MPGAYDVAGCEVYSAVSNTTDLEEEVEVAHHHDTNLYAKNNEVDLLVGLGHHAHDA